MAHHMVHNQGPQDQLLFSADRSLYTHTGYSTSTNFALEYRDVDPVSQAKLNSTARFVIPKAADLLGTVDLLADLMPATAGCTAHGTPGTDVSSAWYWVNKVGFAMIDKVTMFIGPNELESLTGEQLDLMNELYRDGKDKLGWHQIMRDAKRAAPHVFTGDDISDFDKGEEGLTASGNSANGGTLATKGHYTRFIGGTNFSDGNTAVRATKGHKLMIPLQLFFCRGGPSNFFPLGAIAGCNEIIIEIKFKPLEQLIGYTYKAANQVTAALTKPSRSDSSEFVQNMKLRCTFVHLTGVEASLQMNKEHVRLQKEFKTLTYNKVLASSSSPSAQNWSVDLSFLHPVSHLIITFRKVKHLQNSSLEDKDDHDAAEKGPFNYYGSGRSPLLDHANNGSGKQDNLKLKSLALTINGQERMPGLGNKLDVDYLKHRIMPQLFSSSDYTEEHLGHVATGSTSVLDADGSTALSVTEADVRHELQMNRHFMYGAQDVFVYPFCLYPEASSPSGSLNFSKVSHAKLTAEVEAYSSSTADVEWQMSVHAVNYNWLVIKDGRGLKSFA